MRGWHNESYRHSLAARGIPTRARALIRPSGKPDPRKIKHLTRIERSIKDLGHILSTGRMEYTDDYVYGGLTTAWPIDEGANVSGLGWVILSLDPKIMLKHNDLIKIDYTPEFFEENEGIGNRVRGNITAVWEPEELTAYKDEQEVVSYKPIMIPPEAVKEIEIHYGDDIPDPITGNEEDETPWEPGSEEHLDAIIWAAHRSIPHQFWDRTFIIGYDHKQGRPVQYNLEDYEE